MLLTGTSLRWEGRTKAWKLGWRNLHQAETASVSAEVVVEGAGPLTAMRTWRRRASLGTGVAGQGQGRQGQPSYAPGPQSPATEASRPPVN